MRDVVSEFADLMDHRLNVKMDKYGGDTWLDSTCSVRILLKHLKEQVENLEDSLYQNDVDYTTNKAVDVANIAMMIYDRTLANHRKV